MNLFAATESAGSVHVRGERITHRSLPVSHPHDLRLTDIVSVRFKFGQMCAQLEDGRDLPLACDRQRQ